MTFARRSDASTLSPLLVNAPFEHARRSGTVARPLAQSSEVRVTYTGASEPRRGTLSLVFENYTGALAGLNFFTAASLFEYDGVNPSATSDYVIVDGFIVESADADTGDFAIVFAVPNDDQIELSGTQGTGWELRVPYLEVPE